MDNEKELAGSAARHHETEGGNVQPGQIHLPTAGDAARKAATEGDSINEVQGIRTAARGEYRGLTVSGLPRVVGARLVEPEKPKPDLSLRTAADYLPPQLKAQLIAEGKLAPGIPEAGREIPPAAPEEVRAAPSASSATGTEPQTPVEQQGSWGTRIFRKLFSPFTGKK